MDSVKNIAAIVLAAGSSSRLGQPKQLVPHGEKTLLRHAMDIVSGYDFGSKLLVLGAHHEAITKAVGTTGFEVLHNPDWREGIGSSIRTAANYLMKDLAMEHALYLLSDQPFLSGELIGTMLRNHNGHITACGYQGRVGVPVIFSRTYFSELTAMKGDHGAKKVIEKHLSKTTMVDFEMGYFDVDTPEDLARLKALNQEKA